MSTKSEHKYNTVKSMIKDLDKESIDNLINTIPPELNNNPVIHYIKEKQNKQSKQLNKIHIVDCKVENTKVKVEYKKVNIENLQSNDDVIINYTVCKIVNVYADCNYITYTNNKNKIKKEYGDEFKVLVKIVS
jgi:hypothetical protein